MKKVKNEQRDWYSRGETTEKATKYRKGACENCGSMSHKTLDCLERPRYRGAKLTNKDIKPDHVVSNVKNLNFEEKRDRWNGYDSSMYNEYYNKFSEVELEKRKQKAEELIKKSIFEPEVESKRFPSGTGLNVGEKKEEKDKDSDDEGKAIQSSVSDPKTRTTVRDLRMREDTAKYLINLDLDSAEYDPKTRSMRENPTPEQSTNQFNFVGDQALAKTGDYHKFEQVQKFAWEQTEKGSDLFLEASPSQAELLHKQFLEKKAKIKQEKERFLKEKYQVEDLKPLPKELVVDEKYVEYDKSGKVKNKLIEDLHVNGHNTVWGSFWKDGKWGYKCCEQLEKDSTCTKQN